MRSFLKILAFSLILLSATPAFAGTRVPKGVAGICHKLIPFNNVLYKYETSGGIGNSDPRDGSCTLVAGAGSTAVSQFPHRNPLNVYDSNGRLIGKFGLYQYCPDCAFSWRYYTENSTGLSHICSSMVNAAHKDTKNYKGYISLPNMACYYVADLRERAGNAIP